VTENFHALTVGDVDIPRGWVRVVGKGDKERRVPVDADVTGMRSRPTCSPNDPTLMPMAQSPTDCSWWPRAATVAAR
jgi:hypothetical protein